MAIRFMAMYTTATCRIRRGALRYLPRVREQFQQAKIEDECKRQIAPTFLKVGA